MDISQDDKRDTHFGFRRVGETEKASLVADVFRSVAERYDLMNDLMTFGQHRRWKKHTARITAQGLHGISLDIACGTGDLARALSRSTATVTVSKRAGLHFTWFVYRGPEQGVEFNPPQIKPWEDTRPFANSPWAVAWAAPEAPENGRWVSEVTFTQPGTYVLRGRADDGGLFSDVEVMVVVRAAVS